MFSLWKRAATAEDAEQSPGVIEMKGSAARMRMPRRLELPQADAARRNWRSIWPSWDEPNISLANHRTLGQGRNSREAESRDQPSVLSARVQPITGRMQASASASDTEQSNNEKQALPLTPPEPTGCSSTDDADYYQVQVTVKVPKANCESQGCAEQGLLIDRLQQELVDTQLGLQKALRALNTRSKECEDLLGLVRELTQSRSQLTTNRAVQSERFEDLQREYIRVLKIVELCRSVSKENLAKTAETTKKLNEVEEELARQRIITQQTQDRLTSQKLINLELRERLNMLERLDLLAFRRESACMVEFQRVHLKETY